MKYPLRPVLYLAILSLDFITHDFYFSLNRLFLSMQCSSWDRVLGYSCNTSWRRHLKNVVNVESRITWLGNSENNEIQSHSTATYRERDAFVKCRIVSQSAVHKPEGSVWRYRWDKPYQQPSLRTSDQLSSLKYAHFKGLAEPQIQTMAK